jgi:hypothetical protein
MFLRCGEVGLGNGKEGRKGAEISRRGGEAGFGSLVGPVRGNKGAGFQSWLAFGMFRLQVVEGERSRYGFMIGLLLRNEYNVVGFGVVSLDETAAEPKQ